MRFLSAIAGLAICASPAFAGAPAGKVIAYSESWFQGQRAVYDAPQQCENLQVPRPRSLQVPPGTVCQLYYTTGCQQDGRPPVERVAVGDMKVLDEPVSFVCSSR